jgi:hypothetical protein
MCPFRRLIFSTLTLLLILAASAIAAGDWQTVEEHWYEIEIAGAPAGWSKTLISRRNDMIRTETRTDMQLRRGDSVVELTTRESFIERAGGAPVSMSRIESTGEGTIEHEWRFGKDHVTHITRHLGRETKRERPLPDGVWLTPRAAERYVQARRDAGAKQITWRTISPDSGLEPVTITVRYLGNDEYDFDGRTLPVTVWRRTVDAMPIVIEESISADGLTLEKKVELGPNRMVMRRSDRKTVERWIAQRDADAAPDLLLSNLVTPNRPIDRVHDSRRTTFRVRATEGERPELPQAGAQRVALDDEDDRAVIVTIDVNDPLAAAMDESQLAEYLAPSSMIDFEDEKVRDLAAINLRDDTHAMELAESLRRRVHRHIAIKTLDTAFASAGKIARTRRGDCTEHAVLLTALLRANEIPARIATGLVYADHFAGRDHVFGWHMWTQAYIDGRWWDFDAVLPRGRFHAGYVLVSTSALSDDRRYAGLTSFIQLLGNVEIEVIDIAHR